LSKIINVSVCGARFLVQNKLACGQSCAEHIPSRTQYG